jgi:hypothetical protein
MSTITLNSTPHLLGLFTKALRPKKGKLAKNGLPTITVKQLGIRINKKKLQHYNKVCNFKNDSFLPATYPHILAFPLHMSLLTHTEFPFSLLGLVHLSNSIKQYRRIAAQEPLDLECHLGSAKPHAAGISFEVITQGFSAGKRIWESVSTFLFIEKKANKDKKTSTKKHLPPSKLTNSTFWTLGADLGQKYAKVSGDFNPIHLNKYSARLFGFKQAIIHGMWSKARILSQFGNIIDEDSISIDVEFKLPVYIPGKVCLNWEKSSDALTFQLLDELCIKPHLIGQISKL